jgi:protease IV
MAVGERLSPGVCLAANVAGPMSLTVAGMNTPPASGPMPPPPSHLGSTIPSDTNRGVVVMRDRLSYWQFLARSLSVASITVTAVTATVVVTVLAIAAAVAAVFGAPAVTGPFAATESVGGSEGSSSWVLSVPIEGPILSYGSGGFGASTGGQEVRDLLEEAAGDDRIKAVVLELSTPGGTIPGSMDIAAGVAAVQQAGKPVVAYVRDLAASGGVWAMVPADIVVAHPGSAVGSIGVIFGPLSRYTDVVAVDGGVFGGGVTTTGGVEEFYITAGEGKDLGNPYRDLTAAERETVQRRVDQSYDAFVAHVATSRSIDPGSLRRDLGASVVSAADAVEFGLVDFLGSRSEAWDAAAEAAQLTVFDVRTVPNSGGLFSGLFASGESRGSSEALCSTTPQALAYHGDLALACRSSQR